jgi:hypothetical protein
MDHLYYLPIYKRFPSPVTFSTFFGNFSYWESFAATEADRVFFPAYFHGLGLTTLILADVITPDGYRATRSPFFWTHIEDKNTRYQGYNILRKGVNAGDNVYRFVRNGVDYIDKIKTALTLASNEDIVGVIQLPMTDRLNT